MAIDGSGDDGMSAYLQALTAEAEAGLTAEEDAELEDRVRAGTAEVSFLDRVRAAPWVTVRIAGGGCLAGTGQVGADAILLRTPLGEVTTPGEWIIPIRAITEIVGLGDQAAPARGARRRLGLASWARGWARERSVVRLLRQYDVALEGTIDRVGADHLDLAVHDPGLPRRPENIRRHACVPFVAISGVHRR